ncbi:ABC transporter transmembrane domain-containing protein, partial [Streptococcus pyogenes]
IFIAGLSLLLLATAGGQLAPLLLKNIIDQDLTGLSNGLVLHHADFLIKLAIYMGLLVFAGLFRYGSFRVLIACANQVVTNLRNRAYAVMQRLPISYFDD